MRRVQLIPISTCPPESLKRRLDKGIRISKNHPRSLRVVFTSQKVFQLSLKGLFRGLLLMASSKTVKSVLRPLGVVLKTRAFSLSLKESNKMVKDSLLAEFSFLS